MLTPEPPGIDYGPVDAAIDDIGAAGFVAVGGRFDPDLRYLTRFEGPERGYAFVRVPGRSVLCAPAGCVRAAEAGFDGEVTVDRVADPAGERAAAILDRERGDAAPGAVVLVPPTIPHDAAVYLEWAGYELRSTTAVAEARVVKSDGETDAIDAVQRAATAGVREAERLLAAAEVDGDELRSEGRPVTAGRLRRATNAELARRGVTGGGNTVVAAGAGTEAGGMNGTDGRIRVDDPVVVAVAPRGPYGYHGSVTRTVVVDSDGGWERRAYVAVESALDAALAEVEAGAVASAVGREADAELAAFGFDPAAVAEEAAAPGHGVGLSRRERPFLDSDAELKPGHVVAVEPGVTEPDRGEVRLSALVVVTADGYDRLGEGDPSFTPRP
ncbi:M24 family metallopeptidase [Halobellus sp. MBLA0160]|uniref:M24 family metallopeptidase n=1 Tax=Halobellus ruber TaxID=2761102 RepID=A0A7J9SK66_9EURY|nr:M24 family metallopeptidase [Halobellus ruber]